jgi:hypothetical protein
MNPSLIIAQMFPSTPDDAHQIPPIPNMRRRNETGLQKAMTQQTSQPFAIRHISLAARNVFHMSGVTIMTWTDSSKTLCTGRQ